ncbi:MAG: hypothetical protein DMF79_04080 [Acidobacteria bacterium]|nr:MAG: hypothetical protein DMF79_04080 [Acidobacteriota bacterium]
MAEGRPDPVSLLFRYLLDERRRTLFPPGARVLEIGTPGDAGGGTFDAAWAGLGALDGAEPRRLAGWLAGALTGAAPPSPRELREAFGPAFSWRGGFALGLLLPAPGECGWAAESPQLFGLLAAAEGLLRGWPGFRGLGAFAALEGMRA